MQGEVAGNATPSLCRLSIKHHKHHRKPAQQAKPPERAHQRQRRHDPPLPPGEAMIPMSSFPSGSKVKAFYLPCPSPGHEGPDNEPERSQEKQRSRIPPEEPVSGRHELSAGGGRLVQQARGLSTHLA